MYRAAAVVTVLLSVAPSLVSAATLVTPPFSGDQVNTGFATCVVANLGTQSAGVTVITHDTGGNTLDTQTSLSVQPGATVGGLPIDFATYSPSWCEFQVGSRKAWRRSMFVSKTMSANDGTQTVVIPAQ